MATNNGLESNGGKRLTFEATYIRHGTVKRRGEVTVLLRNLVSGEGTRDHIWITDADTLKFNGLTTGCRVRFSAVVCFYQKHRGRGVLYDYALKDVMDVQVLEVKP